MGIDVGVRLEVDVRIEVDISMEDVQGTGVHKALADEAQSSTSRLLRAPHLCTVATSSRRWQTPMSSSYRWRLRSTWAAEAASNTQKRKRRKELVRRSGGAKACKSSAEVGMGSACRALCATRAVFLEAPAAREHPAIGRRRRTAEIPKEVVGVCSRERAKEFERVRGHSREPACRRAGQLPQMRQQYLAAPRATACQSIAGEAVASRGRARTGKPPHKHSTRVKAALRAGRACTFQPPE